MCNSIFIGRNLTTATRGWLFQNKIDFAEHPLIEIQLNRPDEKLFAAYSGEIKSWIVTSKWSAKWLVENYKAAGVKKDDSFFCISEKQEKILKGFSNRIFKPEVADSLSLSELIFAKNKEETIVYLKGNKSLNTFRKVFVPERFNFIEVEVYQNTPVEVKLNKEFNTYLFFSPSGVESFKNAGNSIPNTARIFSIGKTTGAKAREVFGDLVFESSSPDETSFVKFSVHKNGSCEVVKIIKSV